MRVSTEVIYAWTYALPQQHRQLWQYPPRGAKERRRRAGRRVHSDRIKWRTSIHDRPPEVSDRSQFGHWESDSVLGAHGTGVLQTTVERVSRNLCAMKLPGATARATLDAQLAIYAQFPAHAVASVTADNGSEFTCHYRLADTIGVPTYFADPYSAWQRGTNERFNGRIRKYLPKRNSFTDLDQAELDEIITEINNRPRKVLGWATPAEVFNELSSQEATITCCTSD
jgi:IS30 family transposase